MKFIRTLIGFVAAFFFFTGAATAQNAKVNVVQPTRVIILGWDGADYDIMRSMYDAGELPNLSALGSLATLHITGITSTKPSWAEILTGLPPEQTGVWANNYAGEIPPGLTIFEKLKTGNGTYNIFISGKKYNVGIIAGEPYANAVWSFDAYSVDQQTLETVYATAKVFLDDYYRNYSTQPLLAFIVTGEPDYQGHQFGSDSAEYAASIRKLDNMLGRIVQNMASHGMANTYILVVSDHGFNHANVPYPIRPIPHNFGPAPFKSNEPNKTHRLAPFGIIVTNFRTFPDGFNNIGVADTVMGLFNQQPPANSK